MSESADEVQYELDVGDAQETIVDLEQDDNPSANSASEPSEPSEPSGSDDEMEQYSEGVQKRINRLTKKMREAERQREEALKYAQNVQTEAQQIRQRMESLDQGYMSEYGQRLLLQQQQVEQELRRAVEMGDSNATVEAQKKLTQISIAANNYSGAQRQQAYQAQQRSQYVQQPQTSQPTAQQQQAAKRADPKAEQWAEKNSWFGKDEAMTFAAFGIHKKLVEDEGFDPQTNDYYNELDSRIKREFPHKFGENSGSSRRPAQTVAGVSRTNTSSGRSAKRVKLSPSQVAIAKKLGVPLEEYAKYVKE